MPMRNRDDERLCVIEARQALVLGAMPIVMYSARPFGDFGTFWTSDNAQRVCGFSSEDFVDNPHLWAQQLHPDDRTRALNAFERLSEGERFSIEYRWRVADGSFHWFSDRAVLVKTPDDGHEEIVGLWIDVTHMKRVEEALRVSNETLEAMIQACPVAITILDPHGNTKLWNPAAERMFWWRADEVLNRPLPIVPADRAAEHRALRARVFRDEAITDLEVVRQRRDGVLMSVSLSAAPLRNARGEICGGIGILADITDRERAEQSLRRPISGDP